MRSSTLATRSSLLAARYSQLAIRSSLLASQKKTGRRPSKRLSTGYIECFGLSAAKWSRWEKRESLSVLLHKPLSDFGEPYK